ncbi:HNH endonuclease [Microbacterium sp. Leaf320]|uniref:HNH endonuclease n=1 Tax=Microbacterium sp. Leaf320 TaxID=1736334 RepID=UPI00138F8257
MRQYQRQGNVCAYCKQPADGLPDPEHVLALSRGGRNDMSNLVASCRACNADKIDLTLSEWKISRERRGLPPVDTELHAPEYRHLAHNEPTSPAYSLAAQAA